MPTKGILTAAVSATLLCAALRADVVDYVNADGKKSSVRGTIQSETRTEVTVQTPNGNVAVPVWQIDAVRYDRQPPELATIRSRFEQGRYEEIINELKELGKSIDAKNDQLQGQLLFTIFRASAEWAINDRTQLEQAVKWYDRLLENFSDSRHYYPAHEAAGRMFLAAGEFEKAAKAFSALKELDWPGYREKATLYDGVAKLKQNRVDESIAAFDAVLSSQARSPAAVSAKHLAAAYKGEALVQANRIEEAEKLLRAAVAEIPPDQADVQALAHNALGDALRIAKRPKEAILEGYMVVHLMFPRDPEQSARALYHLSQLCGAIQQPERGKIFAQRLRADYPESTWARKLPTP